MHLLWVFFSVFDSSAKGNMHVCKQEKSELYIVQPANDYRTADEISQKERICDHFNEAYSYSMGLMNVENETEDAACLDEAYKKFGYHAFSGKQLVQEKHYIRVAIAGQIPKLYTPKEFRGANESAFKVDTGYGNELRGKEPHRVLCASKLCCHVWRFFFCFIPPPPPPPTAFVAYILWAKIERSLELTHFVF